MRQHFVFMSNADCTADTNITTYLDDKRALDSMILLERSHLEHRSAASWAAVPHIYQPYRASQQSHYSLSIRHSRVRYLSHRDCREVNWRSDWHRPVNDRHEQEHANDYIAPVLLASTTTTVHFKKVAAGLGALRV